MNYASYVDGHSIANSVDRGDLSVRLSMIGASLPRELEARYRCAVQKLMESHTKADLLREAERIVRDLEQIAHDEEEAVHTPRNQWYRNSIPGTACRVRNKRKSRK